MGGIPGRFLSSFGWTMAFSIAVSLLVSFTLTPMLCGALADGRPMGPERRPPPQAAARAPHRQGLPAHRARLRALPALGDGAPLGGGGGVARHARLVRASHGGGAQGLPAQERRGPVPGDHPRCRRAPAWTPPASSPSAWRATSARSCRRRRSTLITIGDNTERAPNVAGIFVKVVDPEQRTDSQDELMGRVRREITSKLPKELPRVSVSNAPLFSGGGSQAAVMYVVTGAGLRRAGQAGQHAAGEAEDDPRRGGCGQQPHRRQARGERVHRPLARRGPGRAGARTWPARCSCSWAASTCPPTWRTATCTTCALRAEPGSARQPGGPRPAHRAHPAARAPCR